MADTPLVAVRGLRKRYGGVVAVDSMNLAVRRGAIHAVVGENGAGKSTLMKVLAGVVRPDAGEIEIRWPSRRKSFRRLWRASTASELSTRS